MTPAGVTYPGCQGTSRVGEHINVAGSGFAPSTPVTVYATSPAQASLEQQIGQVTSDSTGAISTVVSIPLCATGFPQARASAGLIGFDAIGNGADGTSHADALSMEGWQASGASAAAPRRSPAASCTAWR